MPPTEIAYPEPINATRSLNPSYVPSRKGIPDKGFKAPVQPPSSVGTNPVIIPPGPMGETDFIHPSSHLASGPIHHA